MYHAWKKYLYCLNLCIFNHIPRTNMFYWVFMCTIEKLKENDTVSKSFLNYVFFAPLGQYFKTLRFLLILCKMAYVQSGWNNKHPFQGFIKDFLLVQNQTAFLPKIFFKSTQLFLLKKSLPHSITLSPPCLTMGMICSG